MVMLFVGITLYCARVKIFFVYPGIKPPPAKVYEIVLIAVGWGLFIFSIISGF